MKRNLADHILSKSRIVFVDGACAICNRSAHMILRKDKSHTLLVASLQSPLGQEACHAISQNPQNFDTAIFLDQGVFYEKSTAILRIGLYFAFVYSVLARTVLLVPKAWRDKIYDLIAKNRHYVNRKITCRLPPANLKSRILD